MVISFPSKMLQFCVHPPNWQKHISEDKMCFVFFLSVIRFFLYCLSITKTKANYVGSCQYQYTCWTDSLWVPCEFHWSCTIQPPQKTNKQTNKRTNKKTENHIGISDWISFQVSWSCFIWVSQLLLPRRKNVLPVNIIKCATKTKLSDWSSAHVAAVEAQCGTISCHKTVILPVQTRHLIFYRLNCTPIQAYSCLNCT